MRHFYISLPAGAGAVRHIFQISPEGAGSPPGGSSWLKPETIMLNSIKILRKKLGNILTAHQNELQADHSDGLAISNNI